MSTRANEFPSRLSPIGRIKNPRNNEALGTPTRPWCSGRPGFDRSKTRSYGRPHPADRGGCSTLDGLLSGPVERSTLAIKQIDEETVQGGVTFRDHYRPILRAHSRQPTRLAVHFRLRWRNTRRGYRWARVRGEDDRCGSDSKCCGVRYVPGPRSRFRSWRTERRSNR